MTFNRFAFTEESARFAKSVADFLEVWICFNGYTDNSADCKKSYQKRAQTVVNILMKKGIAVNRLTAVVFIEENPIADNSTNAERIQNCRVDFS